LIARGLPDAASTSAAAVATVNRSPLRIAAIVCLSDPLVKRVSYFKQVAAR
jgi:hypothetical protein